MTPGASRNRRTWLKLAILLGILALLAWTVMIAADYFRTGEPLTDSTLIPGVVTENIRKPSYKYVNSVSGPQSPLGVAIGKDGRIYVTETGGERKVRVYNQLGQEVTSFSPPDTAVADRVPVYLSVSPLSGDVYVSDRGKAALYIFSADGEFKGSVTPPEGEENWHPLGVAFDRAGYLYVADVTPEKHRILVLNPDGALKFTFGSQGSADGQFWFPNGLAIDSEGRIFVADSNNGRVQVFDKDGAFLFKINRGQAAGDLSMPRGIAVSEDRLIISDTSRGAVQIYQISKDAGSNPQSKPVKYLDGFAGSDGSGVYFQYPNGLAVDGQGNIYVADRGKNRVQVWKE